MPTVIDRTALNRVIAAGLVVLALLIVAAAGAPGVDAAAVRIKKPAPVMTDLGSELAVTGTIAGFKPGTDAAVRLRSIANRLVDCLGADGAPLDDGWVDAKPVESPLTFIPGGTISARATAFSAQTAAPPPPTLADFPSCPEGTVSVQLVEVFFREVTIEVYQPSDTLVLSKRFVTSRPRF